MQGIVNDDRVMRPLSVTTASHTRLPADIVSAYGNTMELLRFPLVGCATASISTVVSL